MFIRLYFNSNIVEEDDLTSDFYFDRTAVVDHVQFPAESPQIEAQETTSKSFFFCEFSEIIQVYF